MATFATQPPNLSPASSARCGGGARVSKGADASKQSRREPRRNGGYGGSRDGRKDAFPLLLGDMTRILHRAIRALIQQREAPSHTRLAGSHNANINSPVRPSAAGSVPSKSKRRRIRRQRARAIREQHAGAAGRAAAEVGSARKAGAFASLHSASRGNTARPHASAGAPMELTTDCRHGAAVAAAPAAAAAVTMTYREAMQTDSKDEMETVTVAQPTQPPLPLGFVLNPSAPSFPAAFTFGGPVRFEGGFSPKNVEPTIAEIIQQFQARPAQF